jgi:hypothetical protein
MKPCLIFPLWSSVSPLANVAKQLMPSFHKFLTAFLLQYQSVSRLRLAHESDIILEDTVISNRVCMIQGMIYRSLTQFCLSKIIKSMLELVIKLLSRQKFCKMYEVRTRLLHYVHAVFRKYSNSNVD